MQLKNCFFKISELKRQKKKLASMDISIIDVVILVLIFRQRTSISVKARVFKTPLVSNRHFNFLSNKNKSRARIVAQW